MIVAAVSTALFQPLPSVPSMPLVPQEPRPTRSEKLSDVAGYDVEMTKLNAWKQSLVQRMHANHDRYPSDVEKVA